MEAEPAEGRGAAPPPPTRPDERWHTDLMYLRAEDSWYFLVTVLDAYGRYVMHRELLSSMPASDVRLVVQEALERIGAEPRLVTDSRRSSRRLHGSPFTAKDFKQMVRLFELDPIRIRTCRPESNGRVERFHRSTREAFSELELVNLGRARELIGRRVAHYDGERLHAALHYLAPGYSRWVAMPHAGRALPVRARGGDRRAEGEARSGPEATGAHQPRAALSRYSSSRPSRAASSISSASARSRAAAASFRVTS